jgi:hypothetical protein
MSNKTISINPLSFKIGISRSKKNKDVTLKPKHVPLITPNLIKNKLLKRIKDHKRQETQHLEKNKFKLNNEVTDNLTNNAKLTNPETDPISNEFNDSIDYLQILSGQKKREQQKKNNERLKEEIERRTLKNYESIQQPMINIDLPEELMMSSSIINSNSRDNTNELPYGNLKRGLKPTYKEWNKTLRNDVVTNPSSSLIIQDGIVHSAKTARENRLNLLKEKIKNQNKPPYLSQCLSQESIEKRTPEIDNLLKPTIPSTIIPQIQPIISKANIIPQTYNVIPQTYNVIPQTYNVIPQTYNAIPQTQFSQIGPLSPLVVPLSPLVVPLSPLVVPLVVPLSTDKLIGTKHITKKTVKRKYTLGRSQIKRTVSILIKDNGTRKKIINAQKELKRKNINEIKLYLREHNLIKAGSSAPNDILRKLYENAMLAGEITNSNQATLLYNLSKEPPSII